MKIYIYYLFCLLLGSLSACKRDFLEYKSDKSLIVPSSVKDYQALMDESTNSMNLYSSHELGIIGADEYYVTSSVWQLLPPSVVYQKNAYIWAGGDIYEGKDGTDWNTAYHRILYTNLALDGLKKITAGPSEQAAWDNVKGAALFFRAFNFYCLSQLFCKVYNAQTANTDLGIPLRLKADINAKSTRATLGDTYSQIIADLEEAAGLLPENPLVKYRPSRPAVLALLARIYLQMENYDKALFYANQCLALKNGLLDYAGLNFNQNYTFPAIENNPEVIFCMNSSNMAITGPQRASMDDELLSSYREGDLRRQAYYRVYNGRNIYRGSYSGNGAFFTGIAVDEVLLTRAEAFVRTGKIAEAAVDMDRLLTYRYVNGEYPKPLPQDKDGMLDLILNERRKELVLRGTRWGDLRRLNKDPRYAKTIRREVDNKVYELKPGDSRYVWPIPLNVIQLSGIPQNER